MNISVTNACNRRCEYCFQKDWYLAKITFKDSQNSDVVEMSTEEFGQLCKWSSNMPVLKLMGGEPLLHSELFTLIDIAKDHNKELTFISNISIATEKFAEFCKKISEEGSPVRSFLVNSDYPKAQKETFISNFEQLCKCNVGIAISTTMMPNLHEVDKAITRIEPLIERYKKIRNDIGSLRLRISPNTPNPVKPQEFQNADFTDGTLKLITSLKSKGLERFNFDCQVNCCELWSEAVDEFRRDNSIIRTLRCCPATGMPFDVLVDHSVVWCSSANFLRLDDWRKYPSFKEARNALEDMYYKWWETHKENEQCTNCEQRICGRCQGFCIAKTNAFEQSRTEKKKTMPIIG